MSNIHVLYLNNAMCFFFSVRNLKIKFSLTVSSGLLFVLLCALSILTLAVYFTSTLLHYPLSQQISSVTMVPELPINYLAGITVLWWIAFLG